MRSSNFIPNKENLEKTTVNDLSMSIPLMVSLAQNQKSDSGSQLWVWHGVTWEVLKIQKPGSCPKDSI